MIRFGIHCSLRKGLDGALDEAQRLGCEAMQIFTRSPRMWRMTTPDTAAIDAFVRRRKRMGVHPLLVHTPYLPNLATSQSRLYRISVDSLAVDLRICGLLQADYFVIHPGSYSVDSTPEQGIGNIVRGINAALREGNRGDKTLVLLENVAGGGRRLGSSFSELARMIEGIKDLRRVGVCLDTAHALGAGYDISVPAGVDDMLAAFDREIGMKYLFALHCNDSLAPCGSRKDRHQHLGKGYVGTKGFAYLIKALRDRVTAGILETPKDKPGADERNLALLFKWRAAK